MNISGHTQPFAVLGHPIGHTLSPVMHNASLAALGLDAIYLAFDVKPERLMTVLPAMRSLGFGGVNLTIPHKVAVIPLVDGLSPAAELMGAVNCVHRVDGRLLGENTDGKGFVQSLRTRMDPKGRRVAMLVAGGAAQIGRTAGRERG